MDVAGRRAMGLLVLVCSAVVTLAACGTSPGGSSASHSPSSGSNGGSAFTTRARQVVAQWTRSPIARVWRTGLVLLLPDELTSIPRNSGFASQQQKEAFLSGHFVLDGRLPAAPLTGRVRWTAGATMSVPLLTAQATFRALAVNQACSVPPCGHLTVTAARPATLTVSTSRGPATIPAWRFTVAELPFPVTRVAVAPGAYATLPAWVAERAGMQIGGASVSAVSADGRVLTLRIITGACDSGWGGRLYSAPTAVVVGSWTRDSASATPCAAMAVMREAKVTLARPLGTRVILDAGTGSPLVPLAGLASEWRVL